MTRVAVQIYGFTHVDDMRALAGLDIDHVGIVLDEGLGAWDSVDPATALALVAAVPPATKVVGLSLHTDPERILETVTAIDPAIVHLARAGSIESNVLADLKRRLAPARLMTTVAIRDDAAIDEARRLEEHSDVLLLDTAHPSSGAVGATGEVHDWSVSRQVVDAVARPVILAGGLGPHNVVDAISVVRPWGVDSETRTSRDDDRRRKDLAKVQRFVAAAHGADPP
jgi:phosphoribosylanthranilate isomerase